MRTLGVDLAAQPKNTAACVIEWAGSHAVADVPMLGVDDDWIISEAGNVDKVGIDAPFGWPAPFVSAISTFSDSLEWDPVPTSELTFRRTDHQVMLIRRPLSVSTDRIGVTAMRCASILSRLQKDGHVVDRNGLTGSVVEVYPAAALVSWGMSVKGYKSLEGDETRSYLTAALLEASRVEVTGEVIRVCSATDHALDALVAALVARAVELGLTEGPPPELATVTAAEGWIHVPAHNSLTRLTGR